MALGAFCLAGGVNVLWRTQTWVPIARSMVRRGKTDTDEHAEAMRGTLPRNSTLPWQALVAIIVFVAVHLSWNG